MKRSVSVPEMKINRLFCLSVSVAVTLASYSAAAQAQAVLAPPTNVRIVQSDEYEQSTTTDGVITLTIMAAKADWLAAEFAGHAFMCINLHLTNGIKEDCFGFYPKDGGLGFIGTPGAALSEFKKQPLRFSKITTSIEIPITSDQRRQILRLTDQWNARDFLLLKNNCLDFLNEIARAVGLKTPTRKWLQRFQMPETYVRYLKEHNNAPTAPVGPTAPQGLRVLMP